MPYADLTDDLAAEHRRLAEAEPDAPPGHVLARCGAIPLGGVLLRPFARGQHQGPLIEALALLLPLGADRVSVALPGRAWSLDDPVPPVGPGGDLRQRVLAQVTVDGHHRDPPVVTSRLHPFREVSAADGTALLWDDVVDPGAGTGWLPSALATLVAGRGDLVGGGTAEERRRQAERLLDLGHRVGLTGAGWARLEP